MVVVVVVFRACLSMHVRTCSELKMGQHHCAIPFGWTDQPDLPTPIPSEGRFQASPVQTSPNPKSRKKIARLAHLTPPPPSPLLRRKGGAIFSISSALGAVDPD